MLKFLHSTPARVVTVLLLLQTVLLYASHRPEIIPPSRPLDQTPPTLGSWKMGQDLAIDPEIREQLNADDLINRTYTDGNQGASLFVAAFRSQRMGKAPHSPKNCLPGSGWEPLSSGEISIDVGEPAPIVVNRYIVTHADQRSLVLYWYQSRDRVVAGELKAKFWVMADAIRLNRTDTALVRVIVPVVNGDAEGATRAGASFVQSFFGVLRQFLPA